MTHFNIFIYFYNMYSRLFILLIISWLPLSQLGPILIDLDTLAPFSSVKNKNDLSPLDVLIDALTHEIQKKTGVTVNRDQAMDLLKTEGVINFSRVKAIFSHPPLKPKAVRIIAQTVNQFKLERKLQITQWLFSEKADWEEMLSFWKKELHSLKKRASEFITRNPTFARKKEDKRDHLKILRREISAAVHLAPNGSSVIIFGAGKLQDIPDVLFKKFKKIILVDIDLDLMRQAVLKRGFERDFQMGRIQLVSFDLSQLNPSLILEIRKIRSKATSLQEVRNLLIKTYSRFASNAVLFHLPPEILQEKAALVISSTLYPEMARLAVNVAERYCADPFMPPQEKMTIGPTRLLWLEHPEHPDYTAAAYQFMRQIAINHADTMRFFVQEDGIIYFSALVGAVPPDLFEEVGITPTQLEEGLNEFGKIFVGLGNKKSSWKVSPELLIFLEYFLKFFIYPETPLAADNPFWTEGTDVLNSHVWLWRPQSTNCAMGSVVQSLTMRRKNRNGMSYDSRELESSI